MKATPANLTLINSKELFKAITRLKKYLLVEPCTRKHIEYGYYADDVLAAIDHASTIDAVPVVRCGQCAKAKKFHNPQMGDLILCNEYRVFTDECGFCHNGVKMDGGVEDDKGRI